MSGKETRERWHVAKDIPISLLLGMLVQLVVGVWAISDFHAQLINNQRNNDAQFSQIVEQRKTADLKIESIQSTQTQILTQLAALNEDIHELLHDKK